MSYMKQHAMEQAMQRGMATIHDDLAAMERSYARDRLERLAWEAKRAIADYKEALEEFERNALNEQMNQMAAQAADDDNQYEIGPWQSLRSVAAKVRHASLCRRDSTRRTAGPW